VAHGHSFSSAAEWTRREYASIRVNHGIKYMELSLAMGPTAACWVRTPVACGAYPKVSCGVQNFPYDFS
jgi:hypothetical protein